MHTGMMYRLAHNVCLSIEKLLAINDELPRVLLPY